MANEKQGRYDPPMMAAIISGIIKDLEHKPEFTIHGKVVSYPSELVAQAPSPSAAPLKKQPVNLLPADTWYNRIYNSFARWFDHNVNTKIDTAQQWYNEKAEQIRPQANPTKSQTHSTDFRKPTEGERFPNQERTLYHLIDSKVTKTDRSKNTKSYRLRCAILEPVGLEVNNSFSNSVRNYFGYPSKSKPVQDLWTLEESLSIIRDTQKNQRNTQQNHSSQVSQFSIPDEYLIPFYVTDDKNHSHWMVIRIAMQFHPWEAMVAPDGSALPRTWQPKPRILIYEPTELIHHTSQTIIDQCMSIFTNACMGEVVPLKQIKSPKCKKSPPQCDDGAHSATNLFTLAAGESPTPSDRPDLIRHNSAFFKETGLENLAASYKIPPSTFRERNRSKILFIGTLLALSAILAGFILLAPHQTANALFAIEAYLHINLGLLSALTLPQFALVATSAFSILYGLTVALGSFAVSLYQYYSCAREGEHRLSELKATPIFIIQSANITPETPQSSCAKLCKTMNDNAKDAPEPAKTSNAPPIAQDDDKSKAQFEASSPVVRQKPITKHIPNFGDITFEPSENTTPAQGFIRSISDRPNKKKELTPAERRYRSMMVISGTGNE